MFKKIIFLILFISFISLILFFFKNNILTGYANLFIINNAKKGSDLVLILSGNILTRAPHAFALIRKKYSTRIMITKMQWHTLPYDLNYPSDIELANIIKNSYDIMINLEVLPNRANKGAVSTFDEAKDFLKYSSVNKNIKKVILVTDENHSRRALIAFEKIFQKKSNVSFTVSSAPNEIFNKEMVIKRFNNIEKNKKSSFSLFSILTTMIFLKKFE